MCQAHKTFKPHDLWQFATHFVVKSKKKFVFGEKKSYFMGIVKVWNPLVNHMTTTFERTNFKYKNR